MPWVTYVPYWMRRCEEENSGGFGRVSRRARKALKRQAEGSPQHGKGRDFGTRQRDEGITGGLAAGDACGPGRGVPGGDVCGAAGLAAGRCAADFLLPHSVMGRDGAVLRDQPGVFADLPGGAE